MGVIVASIRRASAATLAGLLPHYAAFYLVRTPLWTDTIAESIMANTPQREALWMLARLGPWAKPFAITGGLATLGFAVWLCALMSRRLLWMMAAASLAALVLGVAFDYNSLAGQLAFWCPAVAALHFLSRPALALSLQRRRVLAPLVMTSGTAVVALESYARNRALAVRETGTRPLYPLVLPARPDIAPGLLRPLITPAETFYVMSKNTVDPQLDPGGWRLRITKNGRTLREFTYEQLLSLPHVERFVTLRCVSNNLASDLVGTASWSGVQLRQLLDPREIDAGVTEVALIGADGHGDSVRPAYALSDEVLFAVGMNGRTLNRNHGFPLRILTPRYYGFRSVKWLSEIELRATPYIGTWQKRGFTREPLHQTASHIDKFRRTENGLLVGGISFAGTRGIRAVQVRANDGLWVDAQLEAPLSAYTLTRWYAQLPHTVAAMIEARACDGEGNWQSSQETPLYPEGVRGPTRRRWSG